MAGEVYYFTLPAADLERAKQFYGDLFGWTFEDSGHITNTRQPPGGLDPSPNEPHPTLYFRVDDVQAAVARVRQLGGEATDPVESASGWHASCRDNQGTHFSIGKLRPEYEEK
jgi:predicted enzyme related to lactoylglutathione lyase